MFTRDSEILWITRVSNCIDLSRGNRLARPWIGIGHSHNWVLMANPTALLHLLPSFLSNESKCNNNTRSRVVLYYMSSSINKYKILRTIVVSAICRSKSVTFGSDGFCECWEVSRGVEYEPLCIRIHSFIYIYIYVFIYL